MTQAAAAPRATWRDYFVLTKPKVISLLLMTTVGAAFIAAGGFPGWLTLLGVLVGGYMSAGAAGVYNMVYDADIDVRMKRTANRPLPARRMDPLFAFGVGWILSAAGIIEHQDQVLLTVPKNGAFELPAIFQQDLTLKWSLVLADALKTRKE